MTVELLSYFGDDTMVVNVARVSYAKDAQSYTDEQNQKLISYLATHLHWTPFAHPHIQFRITCSIYVERQLFKTQVGVVVNSISGRYVDFSDTYTPIAEWRKQATNSKQGSAGVLDDQHTPSAIEANVIRACQRAYRDLLELGVAKEQARSVLPLSLNTQFIWTGSFYTFVRLCKQRLKPDAQAETRQVVQDMLCHVQKLPGNPFRYSLAAFGL